MRGYLNAKERELFGLTNHMNTMCRIYIDENEQHMSKEECKWLRSSTTFFEKFLAALFKRVGKAEGDKMIRMYRDSSIKYVAKGMIQGENQVNLKMDRDMFDDYACAIIKTYCVGCTLSEVPSKSNGNTKLLTVHDCRVRDMFLAMDVPEYDPNGLCPYRVGE